MVRVLVLGATGYIGLAIAQALRRNSHIVYGLARSPQKVNELAKYEIIPLLGAVEDGKYLQFIVAENIDVVVNAARPGTGDWDTLEDLKKIGADRLQRRGKNSPKLGYVYVSGAWVHGNSNLRLNDLNPAGVEDDVGSPVPPVSVVSWRPKLENAIIDAKDVLDTLVIRPALLYGRESNLWGLWFKQLRQAAVEKSTSVELQCNTDAILSLVYIDDVASATTAAVEKVSLVASSSVYPVFDVVSSREPARVILESAARVLGFTGEVKFVKPTDAFAEAMSTSLRVDSTRLRDLLGWESTRAFTMLDEIETVVATWQAHNLEV